MLSVALLLFAPLWSAPAPRALPTLAAVPVADVLRLQARLADAQGVPLDGPTTVVVRLFDVESGGAPLWTETIATTALAGVISVPLGATVAFPVGAFDGGARWLSLAVNGDLEMLPRARVATAPLAEHAAVAASLASGATLPVNSVGNTQLSISAVTGDKIAFDTITASKIAAGAITASELGNDSVTSAKIVNGSITSWDLAPGSVFGVTIQSNSIDTGHILSGAVTNTDLASNAVTSDKVADGSLAGVDLALGTLSGGHFAAGALGSTQLASDAVQSVHIAPGAVQSSDLAPGAVTSAALAASSVTATAIASNAVGSADLATDGASLAKVSANTLLVSGSNLVAGGGASAGRFNVRAASSTSFPQLVLTESSGSYARLGFENDSVSSAWIVAARLDGTAAGDKLNFYHPTAGDVMSLTGQGRVGINTTAPQADFEVVSKDTVATLAALPGAGSNLNSELFLGEDATGAFGMRWYYDGALNELKLNGIQDGVPLGPHLRIARNSGVATFGADVYVPALEITSGSDLVEAFGSRETLAPGTVVIVDRDDPTAVRGATEAYARGVVGVVSGAGGVRPGLSLRQEGVLDGDTKVSIAGRVYVRASAENGAIAPGDLLTSAALAGHAMRTDDPARAFGAVIGKALSGLADGEGLVLVLVNLQ